MNTLDSYKEDRFVTKLIKDTRKGNVNWDEDKTKIDVPSSEK